TRDQNETAAGSGFERAANAPRHHRNCGRENSERRVNHDRSSQPIEGEMSGRPDRLRRNRKERGKEVEIAPPTGNGAPCNRDQESKHGREKKARIDERWLDTREDSRYEQ